MYGAFVLVPGIGKIGVGFALANVDKNIRIPFSSRAQGSNALQRIVLKVLKYDENDRPSAQDIYNYLRVFEESIRLGESPPEAGSCC